MRRAPSWSVLLAAAAAAWIMAGPARDEARAVSAREAAPPILAESPAVPLAGCVLECCCTLRDDSNLALRCTDRDDCDASGGSCESPSVCDE